MEPREKLTARVVREFEQVIGEPGDIATAKIEHVDPDRVRDFLQNCAEVFEVEDPPGGWPLMLGAFIDALYEGWDKVTFEEFA